MTQPHGNAERQALYYPFHLCHDQSLARMLETFACIHFRDYMALQVTAMTGTTAYHDRMGDRHAHLVEAGRIIQGHQVSGPLDEDLTASIDRDLADSVWRKQFHAALQDDRRFQRGLFDFTHSFRLGRFTVPGPAAWLRLLDAEQAERPCRVELLRRTNGQPASLEEAYHYDYGMALLKTSAALWHTIRLCRRLSLEAITDSEPHFHLLTQTCKREALRLSNQWLPRTGY